MDSADKMEIEASEKDTQPLLFRDDSEEEDSPEHARICFTRLHQNASIPQKFFTNDAGFDLSSANEVTLYPKQCNKVETGISVELPEGTYGRIVERSSMALKGLTVGGGVIDWGYTGEVYIESNELILLIYLFISFYMCRL